jgi:hypothetical protein
VWTTVAQEVGRPQPITRIDLPRTAIKRIRPVLGILIIMTVGYLKKQLAFSINNNKIAIKAWAPGAMTCLPSPIWLSVTPERNNHNSIDSNDKIDR